MDPALPKLCKREWGPQWILSRKEVPKRFHYWHLLAKLVACLTLDSRPLPPSVNKRLQFDKRKTSPAWVELDFQEASNESTLTNLEMKVGPISTPTGVRVHNSIGDHCHQMVFTSINVALFSSHMKNTWYYHSRSSGKCDECSLQAGIKREYELHPPAGAAGRVVKLEAMANSFSGYSNCCQSFHMTDKSILKPLKCIEMTWKLFE